MKQRLLWNRDDYGCSQSCYALFAAYKSQAFGGSGLYAHHIGIYTEVGGHIGTHGLDVRRHLRRLRHNGNIHIIRHISVVAYQRNHVTQQPARVYARISRVRIREMTSYVAQRHCAKQRIAQGVYGHIGIAVPQQAAVVVNGDTA